MKTQVRKATPKPMSVIARYFVKSTKAVVYRVRPTEHAYFCSLEIYTVTVINGRATGCTCKARSTFNQYVPCKHMIDCQALELARVEKVGKTYTQAVATVAEQAVVGAEHEVALSDFYGQRGPEATANLAALKSTDSPCSLNGTRVPSETSKGATSIEAGLGRRGLLR